MALIDWLQDTFRLILSERVYYPALLFLGGMVLLISGIVAPTGDFGPVEIEMGRFHQIILAAIGLGMVCASLWAERLRWAAKGIARPGDISASPDAEREVPGILKVFAKRFGNEELQQDIRRELEKEQSEILLMGVALKDFFRTDGSFYPVLSRIMSQSPLGLRLRVLLMDPNSSHTEERKSTGSGEQLLHDIQVTLANLKRLHKQAGDLQVRTYDYPATAFVVATSTCVFFEPYFTAALPRHRGCIGGLVPVLKANSSSTLYKVMKGHFWHIWETHT